MQGIAVANQIIEHLVKQGKQQYIERKVTRQKVPTYSTQKTQAVNSNAMIHSGYQHQSQTKRGCFSMKQQNQPKCSSRDLYSSSKVKIEQKQIAKSACVSPTKEKRRSYSYSGLNKRYKSNGFSSQRQESNQKQKENTFVKLNEDTKGRIIIDRVHKRQQAEDDMYRRVKQDQLMKMYHEKKANEMFEKERRQSKQQKQKELILHTSKGKDHKYYFHEGEVVFYREQSSLKKNFPKRTTYNVEVDEFSQSSQKIAQKQTKSSRYFRRSQNKAFSEEQKINEHHRIKSARGQVFASAVLKTINLSRISMNETLRNLQVEQFMKRNDLFNNNHSRQTTSIPYMLAKSGTVYTQLSTNQVLGDSKVEDEQKLSSSLKSDTTRHPRSARKRSRFEPYWHHDSNGNNKTERASQEQNVKDQLSPVAISRGIKTAEGNSARINNKQRRPRTSMSRGRITTANEDLAVVLLH